MNQEFLKVSPGHRPSGVTERRMDKPIKRAKTLDTHDGMTETEGHENGSARKRASMSGGSGSSQRGKKAVVAENPG